MASQCGFEAKQAWSRASPSYQILVSLTSYSASSSEGPSVQLLLSLRHHHHYQYHHQGGSLILTVHQRPAQFRISVEDFHFFWFCLYHSGWAACPLGNTVGCRSQSRWKSFDEKACIPHLCCRAWLLPRPTQMVGHVLLWLHRDLG